MKKIINAVAAIAVAMAGAVSNAEDAPDGTFILQTVQLESEGHCFDSDRDAAQADEYGGAYMNQCANSRTQMWFAEPAGSGHFKLKTAAGSRFCLEGQKGPDDSGELVGAAFMDVCKDVSGQLWKAVEVNGGAHFNLKNAFAGEGKCLEGNRRSADAEVSGWAFMDTCQNVTGQLWIIGGGKLVGGVPTANRFSQGEHQ